MLNNNCAIRACKVLHAATSVERLLLRDKYLRILALEVISLFLLLSITVNLFFNDFNLSLFLLTPAIITLPAWIIQEIQRKKRTIGVFKVLKIVNVIGPFVEHRTPVYAFTIGVKFTIVEAVHGLQHIRYLDYLERRLGEQVLIVLDSRKRVIAAQSLNSLLSLETLMKLR